MKFKIYLRRFGKLIALQSLSRTANGLYIIPPKGENYISYHEDGNYWVRSSGVRFVKKIRQPLSNFLGSETLSTTVVSVLQPMPDDRDEVEPRRKKDDHVIDLTGNFCIEIILSDSAIQLEAMPERINSCVIQKDWKPFITIEIFPLANDLVPVARYPASMRWIEDTNFFINHTGKI